MITISLCMIVKNEETTLKRCLSSIADIVDEIIIVDTGSTDKTKEIALQFTSSVYDFIWCDDFAAARNASFSYATKQYCLWLDADDVLQESDQTKLRHLKQNAIGDIDFYFFHYHVAFDSKNHPTFTYYRERLIKNNSLYFWQGFIHECITPQGKIEYCDIAINHHKIKQTHQNRNLDMFESYIAKGNSLTLREQYYYARELYYHKNYEKAIPIFLKVIDNELAWIENRLDAANLCSQCYTFTNQFNNAMEILFHTFSFATPRCEILCLIGQLFYDQKLYQQAIYWLKLALYCEKNEASGAFIQESYYYFIPMLLLCCCYDKLNNHQIAYHYHLLAKTYQPNHPSIIYNEQYFQQIQTEKKN